MTLPIRAIIIEDEDAAINRLMKELGRVKETDFEVLGSFDSVSASVSFLKENKDIDLIFMDIQLTDGLSLEIFKQVELNCPVIFTTAYDEYALQAFKVNSIDYLLKPIDPAELKAAIDKYKNQSGSKQEVYMHQLMNLAKNYQSNSYRSSFLVWSKQKMLMINTEDVGYVYVKERGVFLKKKDGTEYVIDFFLDDLESQLDPSKFYRANRQFLVARSAIQEIEPYFNGRLILKVSPQSHTPIIISKEKAGNFKRWADY